MRTSLVLATALVVGIAPVALGGAAAVAAPVSAQAGTTAETGAVVQEGGRLTVPAGPEGPVTLRFKATLPAGVTGPVETRVTLPITNWPAGGWTDHRTAERIDSTCSVGGGAFEACAWRGTSLTDDAGPSRVLIDLPAVEASATLDFAVTLDLSDDLGWIGSLDAPVELKDASGTVVARGTVGLDVVESVPAADARGAVHARDKNGVLWRYEATGKADRSLTPRKRIGGGWNGYSEIVQLTPTTAAGTGDLIALGTNGVLWLHEGTGDPAAPFASGIRVEGGGGLPQWADYTTIASNGAGGLFARDKAGVLWNFQRGGEGGVDIFEPRVRVGSGWNIYTEITAFGDGLVARDGAGTLWKYNASSSGSPSAPFTARWKVGGGWNVYNDIVGTKELGRWSRTELFAQATDGTVWAYDSKTSASGYAPGSARTQLGWGWDIYTAVI
ncbi:hypothetical protein [Streptomyces sp. NPDC002057]|uniref:hypothetical protein n=1 Tax=Streptomyces sp. NPDC002057 TaxID=3154664 RepID=UPI00332CB505